MFANMDLLPEALRALEIYFSSFNDYLHHLMHIVVCRRLNFLLIARMCLADIHSQEALW